MVTSGEIVKIGNYWEVEYVDYPPRYDQQMLCRVGVKLKIDIMQV